MRIHALLLLSVTTALLSGVAFFWSVPSGHIGVWLLGLFLLSSLLTLIFALIILVTAARRSIEQTISESIDRHDNGHAEQE